MYMLTLVLFTLIYKSSSQSEITYRSLTDPEQYILFSKPENDIKVYCNGHALEDLYFPSLDRIDYVASAYIMDCAPFVTSYVKAMRKLNITLDTAKTVILETVTVPTAKNLEDLSVEKLILSFQISKEQHQLNLDFITSLVNLTELEIVKADLLPLPTMDVKKVKLGFGKSIGAWGGFTQIRELELKYWNVDEIPDNWLANCSQLTSLSMWGGTIKKITNPVLKKVLEGANSLLDIRIKGDHRSRGIQKMPIDLFRYVPNVQKLALPRNYMGSNMTLNDIQLKSLSHLTLYNCKIIELQGLPVTTSPELEINIGSNNIKDFQISESDYKILKHKKTATILSDDITLDCDCQHGWLALAIRESHLNMTGRTTCTNGDEFGVATNDIVECTRFKCGNCTCRQRWRNNAVDAYCKNNVTSVPRVQGLRALYAADNAISTISSDDFPETLLTIDLTHNRLSNIDEQTLKALFNISDRKIYLAGNPFVCDCSTKQLLEALQGNPLQVADYENITCVRDGQLRYVFDIELSELCFRERQIVETVILAVVGAIIGLIAITGAIIFRYRQEIKVYLYARGCCLRWLHEEEIDSNRHYDAFISFSHHDEEFVMDHLLPTLDQEYKLCIHSRDWIVGEFIPVQISRSVEQSKRTVIVISKNFMESVWGLLEFRTAHINAVQEGRTRIILVVLDDIINDDNLDSELRSYIKNNTYVRWGDKWFWEKLRYAMPHRRSPPHHTSQTPIVANHIPAIMMSPDMQLQIACRP